MSAIREWAIEQGLVAPGTAGRLKRAVVDAYNEAHGIEPEPVQQEEAASEVEEPEGTDWRVIVECPDDDVSLRIAQAVCDLIDAVREITTAQVTAEVRASVLDALGGDAA